MVNIGGRGLGKTRKIIKDLENKNIELEHGRKYWRNKQMETIRDLQEKNNVITDLEKIINRLVIEKKELVNSIENLKMKYDKTLKSNNFKDYRIDILKSYISNLENRVKDLKYLNNFFSIVIKESFNNEDKIIKDYLEDKYNLLLDQNASYDMKILIQNLIEELNNN